MSVAIVSFAIDSQSSEVELEGGADAAAVISVVMLPPQPGHSAAGVDAGAEGLPESCISGGGTSGVQSALAVDAGIGGLEIHMERIA